MSCPFLVDTHRALLKLLNVRLCTGHAIKDSLLAPVEEIEGGVMNLHQEIGPQKRINVMEDRRTADTERTSYENDTQCHQNHDDQRTHFLNSQSNGHTRAGRLWLSFPVLQIPPIGIDDGNLRILQREPLAALSTGNLNAGLLHGLLNRDMALITIYGSRLE